MKSVRNQDNRRSVRCFRYVVTLISVLVIHGSINLGIGQGAQNQAAQRVPVLITFRQTPGPVEEALVRSLGGTIRHTYHLVPGMAATMPPAAVEALGNNPSILGIDPDGQVTALDVELDNTWGVKQIGAGDAHISGNLGSNVLVGIIDSGIDYTHPDLNDNYAPYPFSYDFVNGDIDPMDDAGHGTHVSGTVAAERDQVTGVVGVAPGAQIAGLKVLNSSGSGNWSDIIAAVEWATDHDIQVTNNSYGASSDPGPLVQAAFDISYAAGVLHLAASGNSGNPKGKGDKVIWPARYDSVIAVGATDSSNNRASFSSTGDAVEVAAPGVGINSTLLGGGYGLANGTSMASPHAAGTAALILGCDPGLTNDQVRTLLQDTADDLGAAGRDTLYGFGLVNAADATCGTPAVTNEPPQVTITLPTDTTFDSGALIQFAGTASDTEDPAVDNSDLVWTSSIDGEIGTGGSFWSVLGDGNHMITAAATDIDGLTGTASLAINVGTSGSSGTVGVVNITYDTEGGRDGNKHLLVTTHLGESLTGAAVTIELEHTSTGASWSATGTTTNGVATFSLKNAPSGSYTTTVQGVTADGYEWDGLTPPNGFDK